MKTGPGFFPGLRWTRVLFLNLRWIFLSPLTRTGWLHTLKIRFSILKLRWNARKSRRPPVSSDYISLEEALQRSGLHPDTLRRLLRTGEIEGFKAVVRGRRRWMVSVRSLKNYSDPVYGFLLNLPGPKLFLRRLDEADSDEPG